jgi:hypothetical protein
MDERHAMDQKSARERMRIELTSDVSPRHSTVLKTAGGTSPPDTPHRDHADLLVILA